MAYENNSPRYMRGIAIGLLGYIGVCTGVAVFYGAETAPSSESGGQSSERQMDVSGTDSSGEVTFALGAAVVCLGGVMAYGSLCGRNQPLASVNTGGVHDSLPFDPDSDLSFVRVTTDLWQRFSPDTGRFQK